MQYIFYTNNSAKIVSLRSFYQNGYAVRDDVLLDFIPMPGPIFTLHLNDITSEDDHITANEIVSQHNNYALLNEIFKICKFSISYRVG